MTATTTSGGDSSVGREEGVGLEALIECGCITPTPLEADGSPYITVSKDKTKDESAAADDEEDNDDEDSDFNANNSSWYTDTTCTFDCTCVTPPSSSSKNNKSWALEGVTILHCEIERSNSSSPNNNSNNGITALLFDIEVAVRGNGVIHNNINNDDDDEDSIMIEILEEETLELCAVLRQKRKYRGGDNNNMDGDDNNTTASRRRAAKSSLLGGKLGMSAGLLGLEYGGGAISPSVITRGLGSSLSAANANTTPSKVEMEVHYGTNILRTKPLHIHTTLIPPLQLTVREVCGARSAAGSTLVEITVEHSTKWHNEDVTVTGIAFQGGVSRVADPNHGENESRTTVTSKSSNIMNTNHNNNNNTISEGKSMQGGELSVIDMSRRVRWGFAPGSAPDLPLVLGPYEAFATVIQIDSGEDVRSRAFLSPISVNAMIGSSSSNDQKHVLTKVVNDKDKHHYGGRGGVCEGERIMITADARWTSSRVGVENSDAFRVDMSLRGGLETACRVGAPLVVSLRVLNLSMEPRDLMLLMAKDGEGRNSGLHWERPMEQGQRRKPRGNPGQQLLHQHSIDQHTKENHSFNTAVVSEVNGYTFGVWGLSGDDDGTTRHHRDHELLAVDAALLLGEVKGQHSIEAELRFVPLREGTLPVPNLKLYDKRGMKWYNCVHTLKIVARQGNV